jgi:hypothetical protein
LRFRALRPPATASAVAAHRASITPVFRPWLRTPPRAGVRAWAGMLSLERVCSCTALTDPSAFGDWAQGVFFFMACDRCLIAGCLSPAPIEV